MIKEVMCHFRLHFNRERFAAEWHDLTQMANNGLVRLRQEGAMAGMEVSEAGRWLIRSIAAVFDPSHRQRACGDWMI